MTAIFVIVTIIFFLSVDWAARRFQRKKAVVSAPALQIAGKPYPLRVPEGIFFAKSHTWLNLFPSGKVRMGVDDFIGRLMERPQVTLLKREGEPVAKGEPLIVLKEGDRQLTVRAPITGEILTVNNRLETTPGLMREELFSNGWAYVLRPNKFKELTALLFGEESRDWMLGEFRRLRDLLARVVPTGTLAPAALQDGGVPVAGILKHVNEDVCRRIEEEFLKVR